MTSKYVVSQARPFTGRYAGRVWCIAHTNLVSTTFISVCYEYIYTNPLDCAQNIPRDSLEALAPLQSSIDYAIDKVGSDLGFTLKLEQKISLLKFASGRDVFVSLPTGYGKSLCYILLPKLFDALRGVCGQSIILVVSPLIALMKDQVVNITKMGIRATYMSDKESISTVIRQEIERGEYQIVFVSPEALFFGTQWRRILSSGVYRLKLVGL